jgi:monofunctional biosynthetic peptidoglycan transglycosylase
VPASRKPRRGWFRAILIFLAMLLAGFYLVCLVELVALRWVNPPTTMVQTERRIQSWIHHKPYSRRQHWVALDRIAPDLQHAVISAEDGRFFQHRGIDWKEVQKVVDQDMDEGRLGRGGSTITQQLVKNLFFTTSRSVVRKAIEFTLAPAAGILPKSEFELYLNTIEWGPGVMERGSRRKLVRNSGREGESRAGRQAGSRDPFAPASSGRMNSMARGFCTAWVRRAGCPALTFSLAGLR